MVAQPTGYRITRLTTADGLSHQSVTCLLQDKYGFMWFGTADGLNRYDGYSFVQYMPVPFDAHALPHNVVHAMVEDADGALWIGTGGGLCRYDRLSNTFQTFRHEAGNPRSIAADAVTKLLLDSERKLWIGSAGGGLDLLDVKAAALRRRKEPSLPPGDEYQFVHHRHEPGNPNSIGSNFIGAILRDRNGSLAVYTDRSLDFYRPEAGTWTHFGHTAFNPALHLLPSPDSAKPLFALQRPMWLDREGRINVYHYGFMRVLDSTRNVFEKSFHVWPFASFLCKETDGNLWFANAIDVICMREATVRGDTIAVCPSTGLYPDGSLRGASAACVDAFGGIWIGTASSGIVRLERPAQGFFRYEASRSDSVPHGPIYAIEEDANGTVWVGTQRSGVKILDRARRMLLDPAAGRVFDPLSSFQVARALHALSDGSLMIAMSNWIVGLPIRNILGIPPRYTPPSEMFVRRYGIMYDGWKLPEEASIVSITRDARQRLWLMGYTRQGGVLWKFDPVKQRLDSTEAFPRKIERDAGNAIMALHQDRKDRIWIGSSNGLFLVDERKGSIEHFVYDFHDRRTLSQNTVRVIHEDAGGRLWFGTYGGGLNLWDEQTRTFSHLTTHNGLASNRIAGILEDAHGILWISTSEGLSALDPRKGAVTNFSVRTIRDVRPFSLNACRILRDGVMLFGGNNGLIGFYPDSLHTDRTHPPLMITAVKSLGTELRSQAASGDTLFIPYENRHFSVEFAALDYRDPLALQYAYKLEGQQEEWIFCGSRRYCSWSALPPGEYRLCIKATNSSGVWDSTGIVVLVRIIPPFYLTGWFKSGGAAVVLLLMGGVAWWRMESSRKRERSRRRIVEAELLSLRLQINPHFFFNSLNAIQSFVLRNEEELANEYIANFAQLMRMVLETSRRRSVTLAEELEMLTLYLDLECVRFSNRFVYRFEVDETLDVSLEIPSMMMQPYVENAVRHGLQHRERGGVITVSVTLHKDVLLCVVEDNGVGRARAEALRTPRPAGHTSLGTSITSDRLEVLNQLRSRPMAVRTVDLFDSEGLAAGTRVEISIPLES